MKLSARRVAGLATLAAAMHVASPAQAQSALDNLSIHGYLTQGYATSSDLPILGIPTDGTADYRSAVLQFRYALSTEDNFVLQFRNRRLGTSIVTEASEDVELQWAFYQRRLGPVSVRVGKVPFPTGLYNETRNVGTITPFYRAPASIYTEGLETIDGITSNYALSLGSWDIEAGASLGAFDMDLISATPEGQTISNVPADWIYAGTIMVRTPIEGVRVGSSYTRYRMPSYTAPDSKTTYNSILVSGDATFDRFFVRSEVKRHNLGSLDQDMFYVQGGIKVFADLWLNGQHEATKFNIALPTGDLSLDTLKDTAVGVRYPLTPSVVLKLEGHRVSGYSFDSYVSMFGPKAESDYAIASMSVAF